MRARIVPAVGLLLLLAVTAYGQIGGGPSGIHPRQSQKLTLIPADQYITTVYNFTSVPGASLSGLMAQQSTSSGVTLNCDPPFLAMVTPTTNRRVMIWERGPNVDGIAVPMSATDEVTCAFHVTALDAIGGSTNALWEFQYGDTNSYLVNKFPQSFDSFGVIVSGSGKAASASVPANKIVCFTVGYGGGAGDTNYVSTIAPAASEKFWIHANPGGGNIDFWANDVLIASLPSLRGGGDPSTFGWATWLNGDSAVLNGNSFMIGPVTVQRVWP